MIPRTKRQLVELVVRLPLRRASTAAIPRRLVIVSQVANTDTPATANLRVNLVTVRAMAELPRRPTTDRLTVDMVLNPTSPVIQHTAGLRLEVKEATLRSSSSNRHTVLRRRHRVTRKSSVDCRFKIIMGGGWTI